jgi:uncharacterized membrane protein YvlD (DUF360 family)
VTSGLLPGIRIIGNVIPALGAIALIFGLVNSLIKPIIRVLTCPLVLLTLGLFTLVINGGMLWLTMLLGDQLVPYIGGQLIIRDFGWAVVGALIISVIDVFLEWLLIKDQPKQEIIVRYEAPPPASSSTSGDEFDFYDPNTGKIKK